MFSYKIEKPNQKTESDGRNQCQKHILLSGWWGKKSFYVPFCALSPINHPPGTSFLWSTSRDMCLLLSLPYASYKQR